MRAQSIIPIRLWKAREKSNPPGEASFRHRQQASIFLRDAWSSRITREQAIWLVIDTGISGIFPAGKWRFQVQKRYWGLRQSLSMWLVLNQWRFGIREQPVFWFEFNNDDSFMFPDNMAT